MSPLMKYIIPVIVFATILVSCEETIKLDLKQTPPTVVIEGLVTNRVGLQSVKVSMTADFYSTGKTPKITDAIVTVSDDEGNEFPFVHNPNDVNDLKGVYVPQDENFAGM